MNRNAWARACRLPDLSVGRSSTRMVDASRRACRRAAGSAGPRRAWRRACRLPDLSVGRSNTPLRPPSTWATRLASQGSNRPSGARRRVRRHAKRPASKVGAVDRPAPTLAATPRMPQLHGSRATCPTRGPQRSWGRPCCRPDRWSLADSRYRHTRRWPPLGLFERAFQASWRMCLCRPEARVTGRPTGLAGDTDGPTRALGPRRLDASTSNVEPVTFGSRGLLWRP
jgi:hypothetical protein